MNTANKLTLLRVLLIPVFMLLAYKGRLYGACMVYIIACITDFVDGYVARKYNQTTNFGKFMDPLADKVLVLSAMCFFVDWELMPGWVVAIVLFREFAVSGMRLIAVEQGKVIAAAWSGKVKTAATMISLCAMLLYWQDEYVRFAVSAIILVTTVYSGIEYFWKNRDVFKNVK